MSAPLPRPSAPPYRVVTERLVLRPWDFGDAEALRESTATSRDHLARWLAWAQLEPQDLDAKVALIRRLRGQFDLDADHTYGVFAADGRTVVGGTGLHPRIGPGAREIGYWTDLRHTGHGFAREAAAALVKVGFELLGLRKVEIRVQPENESSLSIPRRLGFTDTGLLREVCPGSDAHTFHDARVFSLLRGEYAASPAADARVEAYDAVGRRVL